MSSLLTDYHGVSRVALSVPCVVDSTGISRVINMPFVETEERQFHESAHIVAASLASLGLG